MYVIFWYYQPLISCYCSHREGMNFCIHREIMETLGNFCWCWKNTSTALPWWLCHAGWMGIFEHAVQQTYFTVFVCLYFLKKKEEDKSGVDVQKVCQPQVESNEKFRPYITNQNGATTYVKCWHCTDLNIDWSRYYHSQPDKLRSYSYFYEAKLWC